MPETQTYIRYLICKYIKNVNKLTKNVEKQDIVDKKRY